jgi:hypothetical protein
MEAIFIGIVAVAVAGVLTVFLRSGKNTSSASDAQPDSASPPPEALASRPRQSTSTLLMSIDDVLADDDLTDHS